MGIANFALEPVSAPWVGTMGFRGWRAVTPPVTWLWQHRIAETGGWFRDGRRWERMNTDAAPVPIPCAPVVQVYAPMVDRISLAGAAAMGYTIDS